jgi:hypothetical protein
LGVGQRVEPPRLLSELFTDDQLLVGSRILGGHEYAAQQAVPATPGYRQTEFPRLWDVLYLHMLLTFLLLLCLL